MVSGFHAEKPEEGKGGCKGVVVSEDHAGIKPEEGTGEMLEVSSGFWGLSGI